jgi:DNA-binding MarR family transcriptional regulator
LDAQANARRSSTTAARHPGGRSVTPQTPLGAYHLWAMALSFDPIDEARRQWTEHRWGAVDQMVAVTAITRAHQLAMAQIERALKPLRLTFSRYEALVLLTFSRQGALPLGKMGERLMVHPTSVTNAIDRLEHDGFVVRVAHPTDRRTVLAEITPAGRAVVDEATELLVAIQFGMRDLPSRLREQLAGLS